MISSSQRPLPNNTQHSQKTEIHAPAGIRTHNLSRPATAELRLRPRSHRDRHSNCCYTKTNITLFTNGLRNEKNLRGAEHETNPIASSQTGGKLNLEFTDIVSLPACIKFNFVCHSQLCAHRLRTPELFFTRPNAISRFA